MASSSQVSNHSKNGKGRQKVKMEKMENKTNLQVTFSKRRYGLFKKASELCTLTGAEMGIIVFSPGRKVFSFGHPSVHKIIDDCFPTEGGERKEGARNGVVSIPPSQRQMMCNEWLVDVHRVASVAEQNMRLSMLEMQMEADKQRSMVVMELEKEEMAGLTPIERMMEAELVELGARLNALKESVMRTMSYGVMSDSTALNAVSVEMGNPSLNHMDEVKFRPHGFY